MFGKRSFVVCLNRTFALSAIAKMTYTKTVYSSMLYIAHLIYSIIEIIRDMCLYFLTLVHCFRIQSADSSKYFAENVHSIKKLPRHLVVMLGNEKPSYNDLANVAVWSIAAGISFISFYDHSGVLRQNSTNLYKAISRAFPKDNGNVKPSMRLNIFSLIDSQQPLVDLTKNCVTEHIEVKDICIEYIDSRLRQRFNQMPDPDLALCCGPVCGTYGMLPWQVSVTEFVNICTHHNIQMSTFVEALKFYSCCEQRFGK